MQFVKYKFSILAICETWETNLNVDVFQIPGYVKVSSPRLSGVGGGIALFIKDGINFKVRNDLILDDGIVDKSCECIFIEIHNAKKQRMIIGELYRPPNHDVDEFNVSFNTLLTKLKKENVIFLFAGDYNINLINHGTHKGSEHIPNQLFFHLCLPSITKPTRFTSNSSTLIDKKYI